MTSPNIKTMLDVSIAHLKPSDMTALDTIAVISDAEEGFPPLRVSSDEHGYFVAVGALRLSDGGREAIVRSENAGLSKEFLGFMIHARDLGVDVVRFDQASDLEPGFPVYDRISGVEIDPSEVDPDIPSPR